jgi:hypothetical protein
VANTEEFKHVATYLPLPYAILFHSLELGNVVLFHVIPSVEYIAILELYPTDINLLLAYNTDFQFAVDDNVLCVQDRPLLEEVAATLELLAITNIVLFPYAPQLHDVLAGKLLDDQEEVFVEYILVLELSAITTKILFPTIILDQFNDEPILVLFHVDPSVDTVPKEFAVATPRK